MANIHRTISTVVDLLHLSLLAKQILERERERERKGDVNKPIGQGSRCDSGPVVASPADQHAAQSRHRSLRAEVVRGLPRGGLQTPPCTPGHLGGAIHVRGVNVVLRVLDIGAVNV